jgi:ubiquinone/menaquinone biosynthesis C-methylase UbiE
MDAALQRRVQRYGWDRAAQHYEKFWSAQLRPAQDLLLELADLHAGDHVLDVACGTGLVTLRAASIVGASGRVVGTDLSAAMVESLRALAAAHGVAGEFERMDAEALRFADGTFDAALCALGLMYVPDPPRALAELRRVLRPRGRVVAAVWGDRANCGWAEIFPIVERRVASDVCPMFFQLGTSSALALHLELAGFANIVEQRFTTVLHYGSAADAIGAAFAGGPVALAYSRFDEATRDGAHAEYLASIEAYRHGERYEIPGEFVVARGVRPAS